MALALLACALPARAQDEGPIVFGQKQKLDPFAVRNVTGEANLLYRYEFDQLKNADGTQTHTQENLFQETATVRGNGWIYHPNLVDFKLEGTFGLEQDYLTTEALKDSSIGTVYDYDLEATLLRKETAPLTLYSRRSEQLITRQFAGSLTNTQTTYGASMDIRSQTVPTRLNIYHLEDVQSGLGGEDVGNLNLNQNAFDWHSEYRPTRKQFLSWDYHFNDITQTSGTNAAYQNHEATVAHTIDFGPNDALSLASTLYYFTQMGDFAQDHLRWDENLLWHHLRNFETHYEFIFDDQSRAASALTGDATQQTQERFRAGFRHQLYDSLTTTGNVGVILLDQTPNASSTEVFGDLGAEYRKKVPYGVLTIGLNLSFDDQANQSGGAGFQVLGESHLFTDPNAIAINRQGVVIASVVVKPDPANPPVPADPNVLPFTLGVDYTINAVPTGAEIHPVLGGRITNGRTVLVDYTVAPQGNNTVQTIGSGFSIRYDINRGWFNGLALYGRYFHQDQSISTSSPATTFLPDNIDDLTAGAEYRFWRMIVSAEYEMHESTLQPYDAARFTARYQQRLGPKTTAGANLQYVTTTYPLDHNQIDFLVVSGDIQQQFNKELFGRLSLAYRDEQDHLRGPTTGYEGAAELNWRHRQTEVFVQVRGAVLDSTSTKNLSEMLQIGVRRKF